MPNLPNIATVNPTITLLLEGSTAVYVTGVTPIGKESPGWLLDVSVTKPELSLAVGDIHITVAVDRFVSVLCFIFEGWLEITGSSLSVMITNISYKNFDHNLSLFKSSALFNKAFKRSVKIKINGGLFC